MIRIKICGVTKPEQGRSIAQLGATALGFICVRQSPRYVLPEQIRAIVDHLPAGRAVDRVGVFADHALEEICRVVAIANLNVVQLHGSESPEFCAQLRLIQPDIEIIKALRVRNAEALAQAQIYTGWVDTLLLDAYHPALLGGTGHTIDWSSLQAFDPGCPWILAGGITPANVLTALSQVQPDGIDLSSGVECAPGDKDLVKVAELFDRLKNSLKSNWQAAVMPNLERRITSNG